MGNMTAVQNCPVAYTDIISNDKGTIEGDMEDTAILDICETSNCYGGNISPENTAKPYTGAFAEGNIADDLGTRGNESIGMNHLFLLPLVD
jgi:hypothetical protein